MPLTHVILEESASLETSLLGWVLVVFILREVREFLKDLVEGLSLSFLHDSLVDLGRCTISMDGCIEIFQSILTTDASGLIFGVRVGEDNNVVPFVVVYFMLRLKSSLTIGG